MAYYSLHAYDADVWVPAFLGLRQQDESLNTDVRFATDVLNVETPNGVLQPHAAPEIIEDGNNSFEEHKVETIADFYRRWYDGPGSKHWLIAAANGDIYYRQDGGYRWEKIERPQSVDPYQSNVWSWCTYETSIQGVDHPIDVLLMSNAKDGMIKITPPDRPTIWDDVNEYTWGDLNDESTGKTWGELKTEAWNIEAVNTGDYKFGVIERHAERIWGGALPDDPDMLVYSKPYDPEDWTADQSIPADGAGTIQQPSWDGDSFTALRSFGDQLIAFKEHRVWRVISSYDTDVPFEMKEQFGGGAPFFNTIAVDVERIYFADVNGLSVYDGMSVTPFQRKLIEPLWRQINRSAMDQMCGVLFNNKYYLSVPMGNSTVNNALIVVNMEENTILYYDDLKIESLLSTPEVVYATSSDLPGKVLKLGYNSWVLGKAGGGKTKWVSPWMDFGYKKIQKGGFDLYFTPEVQTEAVTLNISIQTEKKTKSKTYTIVPLTEKELATNKEYRNKKLHFGGAGRRFRIIIETNGGTAPWRLIGGLHLVVETDPD